MEDSMSHLKSKLALGRFAVSTKKLFFMGVFLIISAFAFADEGKLENIVDQFWKSDSAAYVKITEKGKITYKIKNAISVMEVDGDMINIYVTTPWLYKSNVFGYADGKYWTISSDDNANIIIVRN